jgi:processive 1,2-diacylglycerol beta-glucosyltransferase
MKYLIFTVSAGNGHNTAAKLIKNKVLQEDPSAEIKIVDVYKEYAKKLNAWAVDKGYAFVCNHLVWLYNLVFKQCEKSKVENKNKAGVHKDASNIMSGMLREIYDYKPDVIIGTHIYTVVALTDLRKAYNIPAKIIGLTLDYGISPYWECATGIDYMFITGDYMKNTFIEKGFTEKQLIVSGIPVGENFSKEMDKIEARKELGLDEKLFTIIIMKAGFFSIKNKKIVKQLKKIDEKIQIIIINGKSEKSKLDLDKRISKANLKHKIFNLGFVNNIDKYFSASDLIVGKAGGLTTTETITKGLPSLIISKLPQQEVYNKKYLVDNGCALNLNGKNTISKNINELIKDKTKYNQLVKNSKKIRKLNVVDKFWSLFKTFKPADYSKLKIELGTNKEIKKLVKNKLKREKI